MVTVHGPAGDWSIFRPKAENMDLSPYRPKGTVPFSRRKTVPYNQHLLRREKWDSPP